MKGLRELMAPVEGRVRLMLGRAIVRLANDATLAQELQLDLLDGEVQDGVEHLQDYGFTSVPHPGAEVVVACIGGLRSHSIAIAVADRRYRLRNLEAGEVALHDDLGNVIRLGRDRIEIIAAARIDITAPDGVFVTGDLEVTGTVTASVDVLADGISLLTHTHGGVQAGAAQTGVPE